jgi:hypothetical protein
MKYWSCCIANTYRLINTNVLQEKYRTYCSAVWWWVLLAPRIQKTFWKFKCKTVWHKVYGYEGNGMFHNTQFHWFMSKLQPPVIHQGIVPGPACDPSMVNSASSWHLAPASPRPVNTTRTGPLEAPDPPSAIPRSGERGRGKPPYWRYTRCSPEVRGVNSSRTRDPEVGSTAMGTEFPEGPRHSAVSWPVYRKTEN